MNKSIDQTLKTKIKCFQDTKFISDEYAVKVTNNGAIDNKVVLEIYADNTNLTNWGWYLEDLLHLGKYSKDQISQDQLYLDWGQKLYVTGMLKVYQEIINIIVLKGISI